MKIVITGATGFIGQILIPKLSKSGAELLLVGRDYSKIKKAFPEGNSCTYDELESKGKGYDLVVHLAVSNSNATVSSEEMHRVNVDFAVKVSKMAAQAGIPDVINVSSTHALDASNQTPYATSKRAGIDALEKVGGISVRHVFLPLTYGAAWSGKLAFLNRLPTPLSRILFRPLAALKPTLHIDTFAKFILQKPEPAEAPTPEVILSDGQAKNLWFKFFKRAIDLLFVVTVFVLLWWALILIWILVKRDSKGSGIFAQQRVGQHGKNITCYKFRTMKENTAQIGTHEVGTHAITKIGHFLRKTKLDELPQIWNILLNEMSLIGPRPCLPVQKELIEERQKRGVLNLKPGISGLAQINDIDMSNPERLGRYDEKYLKLQSLLLDIKIIIATALGRGQGDKTT